MSSPAITVENLSKLYRLGEVGTGTLSHDLNRVWARLRGKPDPYAKIGSTNDRASKEGDSRSDYVWALKDLNFEVQPGEILGVIGKNGAGKSTLLKLLSRVTAPTTGKIQIDGRVASLLEVGTGFHPELTGRENIFLNGAIMGMTRAEIRSRFDDIVDFSGCAKYIDTPVKRYSSGMYVRLAFAVAAHLEPEILIVDEVLAVGDAEFQTRCIGKLKEVSEKGGRTVLFVSHNMAAIRALCSRVILQKNGVIQQDGCPKKVVEEYLKVSDTISADGNIPDDLLRAFSTDEARVRQLQLLGNEGRSVNHVVMGEPMEWLVQFEVLKPVDDLMVELGMMDSDLVQLTQSLSVLNNDEPYDLKPGRFEVRVRIDSVFHPGRYSMLVGLHHKKCGTTVDWIERALDFEVVNGPGDGRHHYQAREMRAFVRPAETWTLPRAIG